MYSHLDPRPDLEAPYQYDMDREERYQELLKAETAVLWASLTDELEVERFMDDWLDDEKGRKLFRNIIQVVAQTRDDYRKYPSESLKAYQRIHSLVDTAIDDVAEFKTQRIYE